MDFFDTIDSDYNDAKSLDTKDGKAQFYEKMKIHGFNFSKIDPETRMPICLQKVIDNDEPTFVKFNFVLMKINQMKQVNILDAVSYLIADYVEPQVALKCLDELNYISLKNELSKKYRVSGNKENKFSLLDFFDD